MLWKIEYIVEGKHLEKALEAVAGIALNMQPPQPVTNGIVREKTVKQAKESVAQHNQVRERLMQWGKKPGDIIASGVVRNAMQELGFSHNNYSSIITNLKKQNYLTTTERRGQLRLLDH